MRQRRRGVETRLSARSLTGSPRVARSPQELEERAERAELALKRERANHARFLEAQALAAADLEFERRMQETSATRCARARPARKPDQGGERFLKMEAEHPVCCLVERLQDYKAAQPMTSRSNSCLISPGSKGIEKSAKAHNRCCNMNRVKNRVHLATLKMRARWDTLYPAAQNPRGCVSSSPVEHVRGSLHIHVQKT